MYFWNFSCESPPKNLAYDEALLEVVEQHGEARPGEPIEVLRLWEMPCTAVVLGRSSVANQEANVPACKQFGVPILRRCSGGATILAGAGCLMYSAVLSFNVHPQLAMIDAAHDFVIDRLLTALRPQLAAARREGICDLTIVDRKFSGNALRLKRNSVLYHGTILYEMDLEWVETLLGSPARQPEYRLNRAHRDFIGNASIDLIKLEEGLKQSFGAHKNWSEFPLQQKLDALANELLESRYSDIAWNFAR